VTDVYLEVGQKRVFAGAVDWPGWCRSGKTEDAALEALAAYAPRYAAVAAEAGVRFPKSAATDFRVVERLPGSMTTDFGAPGAVPAVDQAPLEPADERRIARLAEASRTISERVVAAAPPTLRKGPRGGGRDRDKIVEHVNGAEEMYVRKQGWPPPYRARRMAWHLLDHAWEIEDRSASD
jgi:hypothetical protein